MVKVIVGLKGSGKTKKLVELVSKAVNEEQGDVICIEKDRNLTFDIPYQARLIYASDYQIGTFEFMKGFISGLRAGNYDISHIFIDNFHKLFNSNTNRLNMTIAFVFLTSALAMAEFKIGPVTIGFSSLLTCMMLGTLFCNLCPLSGEIMEKSDRWTSPLFAAFFVISGAGLDLGVFKDGMIESYNCGNFADEAQNKAYIRDNILMRHETLPMGEFAIGTNTTAYRMAKEYQIGAKLPILIAEKTGPHFAVGDTCYSHEEDMVTYNPDGKQIVARENDFSKLRSEDMSKAYFNCHTDITIP